MNVLMVTRDLKYGFGSHINPLVRELRELGVTVTVHQTRSNWSSPISMRKKFEEYDIVHFQGSFLNVNKLKVPTITTVHTLLKHELLYDQSLSILFGATFIEPRSLRNSDYIISVSKILNQAIDTLSRGVPCKTILNGSENPEIDLAPHKERTRGYVLLGGRLIKRKRTSDAVSKLIGQDYPVVVFGSGPEEESLRVASNKWDHIYFLGKIPDFVRDTLYRDAGVFVCPSLYESGPFTVLEAMRFGCPVLCADLSTYEGLIEDDKTGFLFKRNDWGSMKIAINYVLNHCENTSDVVLNAMDVLEKRSWSEIARQTKAVYEEVIEN